jgi:hypothetical protein
MHNININPMSSRITTLTSQHLFKKLVSSRLYSTTSEGTIQQTMTKETTEGGWKIIEKVNVFKQWSTMSRTQKILIGSYTGLGFGTFSFATYNDGKGSLLKCRETLSKPGTIKTKEEIISQEWKAVKAGCNENLGVNFWKSVFFPCTFIADLMPQVVLLLNKKN